ncbi:MAG: sugar transferase [Ktedonobacteraceae bacterium]
MQSSDVDKNVQHAPLHVSNVLQAEPLVSLERDVLKPAQVSWFYSYWQRALDIFAGLCGLLVLGILLLVLAPLLYLDSPGPIFYSQKRLGHRGRLFSIHKIRSMRTDAEQAGQPIWATATDARVTRMGRFLRATHLDELPQAVNILRGEMSLIGPRPERPEYVVELEKAHPLYRSRLLVKPGLTGWTQVQYGYGSSYQDELIKLQYDLYYIEHQSCSLDIQIILKTIVEVVIHHGDR